MADGGEERTRCGRARIGWSYCTLDTYLLYTSEAGAECGRSGCGCSAGGRATLRRLLSLAKGIPQWPSSRWRASPARPHQRGCLSRRGYGRGGWIHAVGTHPLERYAPVAFISIASISSPPTPRRVTPSTNESKSLKAEVGPHLSSQGRGSRPQLKWLKAVQQKRGLDGRNRSP